MNIYKTIFSGKVEGYISWMGRNENENIDPTNINMMPFMWLWQISRVNAATCDKRYEPVNPPVMIKMARMKY